MVKQNRLDSRSFSFPSRNAEFFRYQPFRLNIHGHGAVRIMQLGGSYFHKFFICFVALIIRH